MSNPMMAPGGSGGPALLSDQSTRVSADGGGRRTRRHVPVIRMVVALGLAVYSAGCVSQNGYPTSGGTAPTAATAAKSLRQQWGIEISSLRMSGNGHLIDFRYRVLDPDKAALLGDRKYKPCLIDQATGIKMVVPNTPKLGPLRQSAARLETGKIYFMLFANSGRLVKSGSKVTVEIGDFRAVNLTVE